MDVSNIRLKITTEIGSGRREFNEPWLNELYRWGNAFSETLLGYTGTTSIVSLGGKSGNRLGIRRIPDSPPLGGRRTSLRSQWDRKTRCQREANAFI
ncbi:MAG: hypothetical protein CMM07_06865 [Rhodopirellula sp.]|nr:hypothetical protein [Rhodopirellula sp.]